MKVSVAALTFVLCAAYCSQASIKEESDPHFASTCCFSYTSRQIPRSVVVEYFVTSSVCSQPAVVFITRKGREICTNPKDAWNISGDGEW
uniref:C-C motif chemokine n=1 Tax=Chelydra serpentina TaxID=8475 RepID=A0A8C3XLN7_CHESE